MIASPGDVPEERQAVRELIYEWNALHADERKQVLLPVGWETHSAPDMKGPAQSIINEQVLAHCDLLVGIFWTRIGTATAEYQSGAVEEIEIHIAAGKPTMLYFSEAPVKPDATNNKQYRQLKKFKEYCKPKGLYEGFDSIADFKNKFRRQLQITIKNYFAPSQNDVLDSSIFLESAVNERITLSADEQELLKAASIDSRGLIHRSKISAGTYVETNKKQFINIQSAREIAKWNAVLESLLNKGLIKAVGYKGEVFEITAEGFDVADGILESA
ncbi:hypothetical protein [Hymenobacter sedentarius]|uniref:hypothetical protein n=1 Tax=Hymenobacter sedentarius TaxID=1411621 RepID=UPI000B0BA54F|nr:hypothetical protein [Hymenobacter sedentarius]